MDQQRSDAYSDLPFYFDVDLDPDPTFKVGQANKRQACLLQYLCNLQRIGLLKMVN